MSDPVLIAIIGGVFSLTATVVSLIGVVMGNRHRQQSKNELETIRISVDGRLQQLLDSKTKGARAEGNLEGRAELQNEQGL